MNPPPIDRAVFDELKEAAGADFVVELVDTFLAEAPQMLAELRSAQAAGAAEAFRRAAHSLKTNAHTFGAAALGERARALELGGVPAGPAALDALDALDALQALYDAAAAQLRELTRG